jgi:hypothetical protein
MDLRLMGSLMLAAAASLACSSAYAPPSNSYPGGGNGNGNYAGGGGNGTTGSYSIGTSGSGGGSSSGTGTSGTGTTSGGTSGGGTSSGGTSTGGVTGGTTGGNQLLGPLAFPVASAGQFLPFTDDGGVASQMEIDLSSFVMSCDGADGGASMPSGLTLSLNLYSGSPNVAVSSGTYYVLPSPGPGIPYAAATLSQLDGFGNATVVATGQSGPVIWSPSFSGAATGTLIVTMSTGTSSSVLSGSFVAPFCGNF